MTTHSKAVSFTFHQRPYLYSLLYSSINKFPISPETITNQELFIISCHSFSMHPEKKKKKNVRAIIIVLFDMEFRALAASSTGQRRRSDNTVWRPFCRYQLYSAGHWRISAPNYSAICTSQRRSSRPFAHRRLHVFGPLRRLRWLLRSCTRKDGGMYVRVIVHSFLLETFRFSRLVIQRP